MTTTDINNAAVEAADFERRAKRQRTALTAPSPLLLRVRQHHIDHGGSADAFDYAVSNYATAALTAAMPHLREQIAREGQTTCSCSSCAHYRAVNDTQAAVRTWDEGYDASESGRYRANPYRGVS